VDFVNASMSRASFLPEVRNAATAALPSSLEAARVSNASDFFVSFIDVRS